jgi:hypothetical protein
MDINKDKNRDKYIRYRYKMDIKMKIDKYIDIDIKWI